MISTNFRILSPAAGEDLAAAFAARASSGTAAAPGPSAIFPPLPTPSPVTSVSVGTGKGLQPDANGVIHVYFSKAGEKFGHGASLGWSDSDKAKIMLALEEYTKVLGFTFDIVDDSALATVKLTARNDISYLGVSYGSEIVFNVADGFWTEPGALDRGGYSYVTVIHEFGHSFGLGHPHDTGFGTNIMQGVSSPFDDYGRFDLNQGVYTMMSYNDGWRLQPGGAIPYSAATAGFGWETFGALDIAGLQRQYGIVNAWATGDDVYLLPDANAIGTYFETIWDTGGTDTIAYAGTRNCVIDLTAATLDYSATGGGVVSYAEGIFGGITIAYDVVIENASGGSGDDRITGNAVANLLEGGAGIDVLLGRAGNDTLVCGVGADTAIGGLGDDTLAGDEDIDLLRGGAGNDSLSGGTGGDDLIGGTGADLLFGEGGADRLNGALGRDTLTGGAGADRFIFAAADHTGLGGGADLIADFSQADKDRISLAGIDADTTLAGDQAFTFIGDAAFGHVAGELRYRFDGTGRTQVLMDLDGDGRADCSILLTGEIALVGGDFVL